MGQSKAMSEGGQAFLPFHVKKVIHNYTVDLSNVLERLRNALSSTPGGRSLYNVASSKVS